MQRCRTALRTVYGRMTWAIIALCRWLPPPTLSRISSAVVLKTSVTTYSVVEAMSFLGRVIPCFYHAVLRAGSVNAVWLLYQWITTKPRSRVGRSRYLTTVSENIETSL
ncbi:hypothetical protein GGR51DRAFT_496918 [Nemania sp. FL0031]|nr:hypothetical protein GGR51DRAFT_496918 [Nemania sp. FL0031]